MTLKALIFDVDGTLADTERDGHRIAFNMAFAEAGLDWEWDVATYGELLAVTGGKERMRHYFETYRSGETAPPGFPDMIRRLHEAKTRHYTELLAQGRIPLRPGVRRLLEEARAAGVRLAIATTTTPANVSALLEHSLAPDGESWFEVIGAGDIVPAKKPAPDIYDYVLDCMQLKPGECMAFEDSENGLISASAAKLRTIITINGYTRSHRFDGATIVLDQMGEDNAPFTVLSKTPVNGARYLSLDLVRRLHERP